MQSASPNARQEQELDKLFRAVNMDAANAQNARPLSIPYPGVGVRDMPVPEQRVAQTTVPQGQPRTAMTKRADRLGPAGNPPVKRPSALPKADMERPAQPVATPDFTPTIGERLTNFGNALTGQGTVTNFAERERQRNTTYQALRNMGLDNQTAEAAVLNPNLLQSILRQRYRVGGSYGRQVIWGRDRDGNWLPLQVSSQGVGSPTQLPEGIQAVPPGDIAQQQSQGRQFGKERAKYKINLSNVMNNAAYMIKSLTDLKDDPYLDYVVGPFQGSMISPNISGEANRVQSRIDQILGKTFLQAFESLKGGGQITEAEGRKATDALTRLANQRMEESDYRQAIEDLIDGTVDMINIARQRAGQSPLPRSDLSTPEAIQRAANIVAETPEQKAFKQQNGIPSEARLAPDGKYYTKDERTGQYIRWP